jgi:hypothetical protein
MSPVTRMTELFLVRPIYRNENLIKIIGHPSAWPPISLQPVCLPLQLVALRNHRRHQDDRADPLNPKVA